MNLNQFDAAAIDGSLQSLGRYAGQWVLVVNVASKCGLTPQYEGLEALYQKFKHRGLTVLGFPCDQFGHQEPGSEEEILEFCTRNYGVSFPLFAKIDVNGEGAHPLFKQMRGLQPGAIPLTITPGNRLLEHLAKTRPESLANDEVRWNFTKFLIDPEGHVVKRYEPFIAPAQIEADLVERLGTGAWRQL
jgi:glutathione peroxidase